MKPLEETRLGRLLHFLAEAVLRYPKWFWYSQLLLVVVCLGYTAISLQFSTDKNDLVSGQESFQLQFLEFKREFQMHDNVFVLVESENPEKNRQFVERLAIRLRADGQFTEAYYRAGLKLMGPKALLFLPEESLIRLRQSLRDYQPLFGTFSQATNLDSLFELVNRQFRLIASSPSQAPKADTLGAALPVLRSIVDSAADFIESQEVPLFDGIASLLRSPQESASRQLYLTFDGGRFYALVTQAKDSSREKAAIRELKRLIAKTQSEVPGVNVDVTGEAVLRYDELEQARRDTEVAALIALGLTALIFIASCREILRPLMATFCLLVGVCYTLGFATLAVGRFNILSITLVPILIGLAIDYGVHLIFRYEEELRLGNTRRLAIGKALAFTGIGVITNALTIAGAFYSMMLTDFKGMREMGLISGSGVLLCLVPMLTLLPLLLVRGKPDLQDRPPVELKRRTRSPFIQSLQRRAYGAPSPRTKHSRRARIEQLYLKRPWLVLGCGVAFTIFAGYQAFQVRFDYNLLNLQSRGLPAVRAQKQLISAGSQSLLFCAVVADSLKQAVEWEKRIEELPSVARVISLVKHLTEDQDRKLALIREIKQELLAIPAPARDPAPVDLAKMSRTLFSLSGYLGRAIESRHSEEGGEVAESLLRSVRDSVNRLRRLTAMDQPANAETLARFQQILFGGLHDTITLVEQQDDRERLRPEDVPVFLRDLFISRSGKFLLQVYPKADVWQRDAQETFIRELRSVDPLVTGAPVQFYEYTSRLKQNVEKAAVYASIATAILVFLHFRRIGSVLLALLPVALGFCWMLGVMGWLGISFNPVNIVSLILLIGIGVTNGVHILNRFAEKPHPSILARSTGKAVLISALNTIAGFGSLLVAKHQGIATFGGVMAIGTGTCVLASLIFLLPILTLLCRIGWSPAQPPKTGGQAPPGLEKLG